MGSILKIYDGTIFRGFFWNIFAYKCTKLYVFIRKCTRAIEQVKAAELSSSVYEANFKLGKNINSLKLKLLKSITKFMISCMVPPACEEAIPNRTFKTVFWRIFLPYPYKR